MVVSVLPKKISKPSCWLTLDFEIVYCFNSFKYSLLLCLFWGGCLSGFVNWTFIIASRHLATAEVTLLMLIEFALGPVWVWLFVDEVPSRWTLIGGSVIIAAVAVRAILELMNKSRPEQTPGQPV